FLSAKGWDTENEIGQTWKRFMGLYKKYEDIIVNNMVNKKTSYEVHIQPDDYKLTKKFYVFIGAEVKETKDAPLEMDIKILPPTLYASFTFRGEGMIKGGEFIWGNWLPNSKEYEEAYPYFIQVYEESRFLGLDNPESEIDYLVPIKIKEGKNHE
ncbi:MAG: GyrI-like domain-containing protein, partial [Candidatus Methanofastidiosa archaeon]|nr:GyrI-like domain-containing protein [Candidatus Methanofastidiosa archaeon]